MNLYILQSHSLLRPSQWSCWKIESPESFSNVEAVESTRVFRLEKGSEILPKSNRNSNMILQETSISMAFCIAWWLVIWQFLWHFYLYGNFVFCMLYGNFYGISLTPWRFLTSRSSSGCPWLERRRASCPPEWCRRWPREMRVMSSMVWEILGNCLRNRGTNGTIIYQWRFDEVWVVKFRNHIFAPKWILQVCLLLVFFTGGIIELQVELCHVWLSKGRNARKLLWVPQTSAKLHPRVELVWWPS